MDPIIFDNGHIFASPKDRQVAILWVKWFWWYAHWSEISILSCIFTRMLPETTYTRCDRASSVS